jgi:hypothetical protein
VALGLGCCELAPLMDEVVTAPLVASTPSLGASVGASVQYIQLQVSLLELRAGGRSWSWSTRTTHGGDGASQWSEGEARVQVLIYIACA